jgi:Na+/proline symporter
VAPKVIWLFVFVVLYWAYCIYWGARGARMAHTATDYFIAGRKISMWVFVLAATATSFSGWTFMGHPGLVYRDGFQYAYASFYTITIPFTGVMFLKRQWMLGKRFGYVTPGEMLADYFRGDAIRFLTLVVALLFSIPYVGVQLTASGYLFSVLTDGAVNHNFGIWVLSLVMVIYVAAGGLRAVAYVDSLQCVLLALGIIVTGSIALNMVGGWDGLNAGMAVLAKTTGTHWGTTGGAGGGDYSAYFAIPGVIQYTAGLGSEAPIGGLWTGVMCLTYMFAMMGIQSAPAFSMWAFANNDPRPFAPQQVWASSFGIGLILFFFTIFQGVGAHLLGADPAANRNAALVAPMLQLEETKIVAAPGKPADLIRLHDDGAIPLLGGTVSRDVTVEALQNLITAGAATVDKAEAQAKANALAKIGVPRNQIDSLIADGNRLSAFLDENEDLAAGYRAVVKAERTAILPKALARATFVVTPLPAGHITKEFDALVPYYFNMIVDKVPWLVGLLAVCAVAAMQSTGAAYISAAGGMLTRDLHKRYLNPGASHKTQKLFARISIVVIVFAAIVVGTFSTDAMVLLGGLAVAFGFQMWPSLAAVTWFPWITRRGATWGLFAGLIAVTFTESFGVTILRSLGMELWGRWPLTIHSAGWGMMFNLTICIIVSALTQDAKALAHRMKYHNFLREHASLSPAKKRLKPIAWAMVIAWLFFGIGPGAVVGNDIFGAPGAGPDGWVFGIPSIWAWQILFWLLGVGMMWFLAYRMEMSTVPEKHVEALIEDIGDRPANVF